VKLPASTTARNSSMPFQELILRLAPPDPPA
jgi:hypothetical protein